MFHSKKGIIYSDGTKDLLRVTVEKMCAPFDYRSPIQCGF